MCQPDKKSAKQIAENNAAIVEPQWVRGRWVRGLSSDPLGTVNKEGGASATADGSALLIPAKSPGLPTLPLNGCSIRAQSSEV